MRLFLQIGLLTSLRSLILDGNQLSGPLPTELGQLALLETLWLNDNQLTGEIPTEFGTLSAAVDIDLRRNHLSGAVPSEVEFQLSYVCSATCFSADSTARRLPPVSAGYESEQAAAIPG